MYYDIAEHLRGPDEMAAYLQACLEESESDAADEKNPHRQVFLKAIAQGLVDLKNGNTMTLFEVKKSLGIK